MPSTYSDGQYILADEADATTDWTDWPGGRGQFGVDSFTGTGSVTLEFKTPFDNAMAVGSDTTLTAAGHGGFELPPCEIRVAISGVTDVKAWARHTTVK